LNKPLLWVGGQSSLRLMVTLIPVTVLIVSPHKILCLFRETDLNLVYNVMQEGSDFLGDEDVAPLIWETKQRGQIQHDSFIDLNTKSYLHLNK
jgi:hypothetical protein